MSRLPAYQNPRSLKPPYFSSMLDKLQRKNVKGKSPTDVSQRMANYLKSVSAVAQRFQIPATVASQLLDPFPEEFSEDRAVLFAQYILESLRILRSTAKEDVWRNKFYRNFIRRMFLEKGPNSPKEVFDLFEITGATNEEKEFFPLYVQTKNV